MNIAMPVDTLTHMRARRARSGQRGVSLLIAMVMLVIIGLVSVGVMRNAKSSDTVATNTRAQTQANQYAQVAERFCESQIPPSTGAQIGYVKGTGGPFWTTFANWPPGSTAKAHALSAAELSHTSSSIVTPPANAMPQCMAEDAPGLGPNAFIVTSRGFSLDYRADSKGNTISGSVVWLQAYVTIL